jgi:hypothetical protein
MSVWILRNVRVVITSPSKNGRRQQPAGGKSWCVNTMATPSLRRPMSSIRLKEKWLKFMPIANFPFPIVSARSA